MIDPVPGGPTNPEKRRVRTKKPAGDGNNVDENAVSSQDALMSGVEGVEAGSGSGLGSLLGLISGVGSGAGFGLGVTRTAAIEAKRKSVESVPQTDLPIKRRRRKKSAGEPSIDALCLHVKPGRKAGWAAIQAANAAAAAESLLYSGGEESSEDDDEKALLSAA